jgi:hypothetical protein
MRFTDPRVQALLATLCVFRLLPRGFTNHDLRHHLEPLLGRDPTAITMFIVDMIQDPLLAS